MLIRSCRLIAAVVLLLVGAVPPASAQLSRVGPVLPTTDGFPSWYQDKSGLTLEFCRPNQAELNGGWCVLLPVDVPNGVAPETAFNNYADEHFFFDAVSGSRTGAGAILVLAVEAAFANGDPVAGDQIVFGRLRIVVPSLPASGDYKVYTPYGDYTFKGQAAGDRLFFTSDIGLQCSAGNFDCALNSAIGPFLLPSAVPGGAEVPPMPDLAANPGLDPYYLALVNGGATTPLPGTGKRYIADPGRIGAVTGSPLPPFVGCDGVTYNHNIFRIEGPGCLNVITDQTFSLSGRIMEANLAGQFKVDRASYTATAAGNSLAVFATAVPILKPRLPGAPAAGLSAQDLGYFEAPCSTDANGVVNGPPTVPGIPYYQMYSDGGSRWWGGNSLTAAAIPPQVCVQNKAAVDAGGQVTTAYILGDVTDEVHINWAQVIWDPSVSGGTLTVSAATSDEVNDAVLTLAGFTVPDPLNPGGTIPARIPSGGSVTISELGAPPAKVTVVSTRGGTATLDTTTKSGVPISTTHPTANADSVTTAEDTPLLSIDVLANDILLGATPPVVVTITGAAALGTATVNPDNTLAYTPMLNVSGTDLVGYVVSVNGVASNEGYVTVSITPVNDTPTAVADSIGAPNNKPVTFNVLANDSDVDGAADLSAAVIASLPAVDVTLTCNGGVVAAVGTVCAGGDVTLLAAKAGAFTFTYYAQDQAGAQSVNAATVTLNATAFEVVTITKSQFVTKSLRWTVDGDSNISAGQTLSITYIGGTYKIAGACTGNAAGFEVGRATVDGFGNFIFDQIVTSAGLINPTNTGANAGFWCTAPRQIQVISPLGGTSSANIAFK